MKTQLSENLSKYLKTTNKMTTVSLYVECAGLGSVLYIPFSTHIDASVAFSVTIALFWLAVNIWNRFFSTRVFPIIRKDLANYYNKSEEEVNLAPLEKWSHNVGGFLLFYITVPFLVGEITKL